MKKSRDSVLEDRATCDRVDRGGVSKEVKCEVIGTAGAI
jgi:hypothetical protein